MCPTELRINVPDGPLLYRARASSRRKATRTTALSGDSLSWFPRGAPWRDSDEQQAPLSASLASIISRHFFFQGGASTCSCGMYGTSVCRLFAGVLSGSPRGQDLHLHRRGASRLGPDIFWVSLSFEKET